MKELRNKDNIQTGYIKWQHIRAMKYLVIYESNIRMTNHLESVVGQDFIKTYF